MMCPISCFIFFYVPYANRGQDIFFLWVRPIRGPCTHEERKDLLLVYHPKTSWPRSAEMHFAGLGLRTCCYDNSSTFILNQLWRTRRSRQKLSNLDNSLIHGWSTGPRSHCCVFGFRPVFTELLHVQIFFPFLFPIVLSIHLSCASHSAPLLPSFQLHVSSLYLSTSVFVVSVTRSSDSAFSI